MTASTHQLSCMCGKVKGAVAVSAPTNHVVCYCRDCQAFARFLGQEAILDRHGGTEIVQTNASKVTLSEGMEHLAAIRLTNKGLLRYYAGGCNKFCVLSHDTDPRRGTWQDAPNRRLMMS